MAGAARRDRRHPADVRGWAPFFRPRSDGGAQDRDTRGIPADHPGHGDWGRAGEILRLDLGWGNRAGPVPIRGQHGGSPQGLGGPQRRRDAVRAHDGGLADRRGSGDGVDAGVAARLRRGIGWARAYRADPRGGGRARPRAAVHLHQGQRLRADRDVLWSARDALVVAPGRAHRLARAFHAVRSSPSPSASPLSRPSCSASPMRSGRFLPAW